MKKLNLVLSFFFCITNQLYCQSMDSSQVPSEVRATFHRICIGATDVTWDHVVVPIKDLSRPYRYSACFHYKGRQIIWNIDSLGIFSNIDIPESAQKRLAALYPSTMKDQEWHYNYFVFDSSNYDTDYNYTLLDTCVLSYFNGDNGGGGVGLFPYFCSFGDSLHQVTACFDFNWHYCLSVVSFQDKYSLLSTEDITTDTIRLIHPLKIYIKKHFSKKYHVSDVVQIIDSNSQLLYQIVRVRKKNRSYSYVLLFNGKGGILVKPEKWMDPVGDFY